MADNIKPRSPFERAAAQVQSKRVATPEVIAPTQAAAPKRSTAKVRARLNDEPDDRHAEFPHRAGLVGPLTRRALGARVDFEFDCVMPHTP